MLRLIALAIVVSFFVLPLEASTIRVSVKGMVCGFCAQGIEKKFSAESAIKEIDVNFESQLVTLKLKVGQDLKDEKIIELVRDAGFTPVKIERI